MGKAYVFLGQFDGADRYANEVLYHIKNSSSSGSSSSSTRTIVEKAKAKAILVHSLVMQKRYADAIDLGIKSLQKMAVEVDKHTKSGYESDLKSAKKLLDLMVRSTFKNDKSDDAAEYTNPRAVASALVHKMQPLEDEKSLVSMMLLNLLYVPAIMVQSSMVSSIAYRMMKISIQQQNHKHGNICPSSAIAFVVMGSYFYNTGDTKRGSLCEYIGIEIDSIFRDKSSRGRMWIILNSLTLPRRQGFQTQLKVAYRLCNDSADSEV
jgi:hypothetical protein